MQIYRHVILAETIVFISFETGSHYVANAGLEYLLFRLQDPENGGGIVMLTQLVESLPYLR